MNRRELLKSTATIAAVSLFPYKNIVEQKTHFIGLGKSGAAMLKYLSEKNIEADYTCIGKGYNGIYSPITQMPVNTNFKGLLSKRKNYVLLTGIGGETGSLLIQSLVSEMNVQNVPYTAIITIPFAFEGNKKSEKAANLKSKLAINKNVHFLEMQTIKEKYGNMLIKDGFIKANEEIYKMII